jgi:hypothetical protein
MNSIPPPLPAVPPVIPPNFSRPPQKFRMPWFVKIIFALVVLFFSFLGFRVVQFALHVRDNPVAKAPGEAEFREANRAIIANRGTVAFGNNAAAVALAERYANDLKLLREGLFTEGKKDALSLAKGEFLTFCQRTETACVFLVHVPELRRFTEEAKASLVELAWLNAQAVLKNSAEPPPATVAVGVKGAVFYEAVWVGKFAPDAPGAHGGVETRASGLEGTQLLYPFFVVATELDGESPPPITTTEDSAAPEN